MEHLAFLLLPSFTLTFELDLVDEVTPENASSVVWTLGCIGRQLSETAAIVPIGRNFLRADHEDP